MADTQRIRRAPHNAENPFAQISRAMLQDKDLSYEARGLLAYLLSKPGDWNARVNDLQMKGAGRDKIYRILAELQAKHYIGGHDKYQDDKGRWCWLPYDVYETPHISPLPENPFTDSASPSPDYPYTENTEIYIQETHKIKNKESAASVEDRARTANAEEERSLVKAKTDAKRITETLTSSQPSSSPVPRAPKPRSAAQLANDALVTALREAWFKGRGKVVPDAVGSTDYSLYLKRAKELVERIPVHRFEAYVKHWHGVSVAGNWTLTLNSLTSNGRIDDFLSQTAQSAPLMRQAYDPRRDPAYNTAVDK